MKQIGYDDVRRLAAGGAQIVEVLPREEYEHEHIEGAISIPLKELEDRVDELDRDRPVILYCNDFL